MFYTNTVLLANRVLKQLIRDRRTIGMILVMPILITLIFGYAIGGTVQNVPVIIVNKDTGFSKNLGVATIDKNLGNSIYGFMSNDTQHRAALTNGTDFTTAEHKVDQSEYTVAIFIPANFSYDLIAPQFNSSLNVTAQIQIYIDDSEPSLVASVIASLQDAISNATDHLIPGHTFGIQIKKYYANNFITVNSLDVAIPGVIALILNFLILLFSTLLLVRENTYRTRARLLATPIKPQEIILGYSIALGILALFMSLSVMLISVFIFNVTVHGDLIELFICILIFGLSFVFLGVFLSNFARNELQAVQMGPLIAFPSMALSGFLVPVKVLPSFLQPLSNFVPMTYGIRLFQGIMLKGYSITDMLPDFAAICFIAILFLILALISIKPTEN